MYSDPRSIFQKKIQTILKSESKEVSKVFEKIFTLQQSLLIEKTTDEIEKNNWRNILELYSLLGLEKFIAIINHLKGKTITIPTDNDLKESILTVLCFYYKEIENRDWEEIRNITGLQKTDTIKYGIKSRQLDQFINSQLNKGDKDYGI